MQCILAIAIGDPTNSRKITGATQLNGVRPYIIGLYSYLSQHTDFKLGTDYWIDYQECWEDQENFTGTPDIIFCMSTPVVRKARDFSAKIPIVGIFSNYAGENFNKTNNICGLNGKRIPKAKDFYDCFVQTINGIKEVYILHRENNTASNGSLNVIQKAGGPRVPISVLTLATATTPPGTDPRPGIAALIDTVPRGPQSGLLVLPVDVFFGVADFIFTQAAARLLSVAWPAPDWVPPAICAHGASQSLCGGGDPLNGFMGAQVAYILAHPGATPGTGEIPPPPDRFVDFPDDQITCMASVAAAKALRIELRERPGLQIV